MRCWQGTPTLMMGAHRHDEIELNLVLGGSLDYLIAGEHLHVPDETLLMFWAARPHQLIGVDESVRVHWLTVPIDTFLSWGLPAELRAGLIGGVPHALPVPGPTQGYGRQWAQWESDLMTGEHELQVTVLLEMEARVRRLAYGGRATPAREAAAPDLTSDGDAPHEGPSATTRLIAMAGFISRHFSEPIAVADVAAAAHVHPHHAMTLFRQASGMTIGTFVTQCRIAEAQRLLVATDLPVANIAHAAGFGSLARFYQAFGAVCGQPPGAYRRRLRS